MDKVSKFCNIFLKKVKLIFVLSLISTLISNLINILVAGLPKYFIDFISSVGNIIQAKQ